MAETKIITSMMEEKRIFNPPKELVEKAYIKSIDEYKALHKRSMEDPEGFWAEKAEEMLDWYKKWDKVLVEDFTNAKHEWFVGGKLNVCYNCLDRYLNTWRKNKAAIIWEGEPVGESKTYTYQELHHEVCKFANVLKKLGVKKGDRVSIYLPVIPEAAIAMLACARIGAIHTIVFGGFSAEALRDKMLDCKTTLLICTDGYYRNGRTVNSKVNADNALTQCPDVKTSVVVKRIGMEVNMQSERDLWWHELMADEDIKPVCEPEVMDAEDPLFILYTSGGTGKPKGVLHTSAGYLLYAALTLKWIFDIKEENTFWAAADIGWLTGHSCAVYGPLALGTTSIMYEGVPSYPKPDRFWAIVEKYKVNQFCTAPTVIRALMREGEEWLYKHDLSSLKILGSMGEPINPKVWMWYHTHVGRGKCPIMDTFWQTETGGPVITPIPAVPLKPGSATLPFPGIMAQVVRDDGSPAGANEGGLLVFKKPWPGLMRRIHSEPERFKETYFVQIPGNYMTGDGARCDEDGYYWIMGRIDDVINVSGHRIGTAEVESALVAHEKVAEAAVVGMPHDLKGQGVYAFVTLKTGVEKTEQLKKELVAHVRKEIGPIATPDKIQFADDLPKTRSGKIMRRILMKIAAGDVGNLGDISTLADPVVIDDIVKGII